VKREFRISETKLYYNISKFGNSDEIDIPFENLNGEKVSFKKSNNVLLLVSVIIYLIAIAISIGKMKGADVEQYADLFWGIIGTIVLVVYFFTKENFWKIKLVENNYIYFHKKIPSENQTNEFLTELIEVRNSFLNENYGIIDENLDYQTQLNNFKWLKSINAISKKEFEEKYKELKKTVKPEKSNIGYGQN
tara:strand:+ start:541 stop:1116 length:576 start_codon:yes stop_codon:yes gene_type:complete